MIPKIENTDSPIGMKADDFFAKYGHLNRVVVDGGVITATLSGWDSPESSFLYDVITSVPTKGEGVSVNSDPAALTQERGKTHGRFLDHANYTQRFKRLMYRAEAERHDRGQPPLTPMQREALEMIFHKIGRILAGEASFQDHWDDIAGYAHLPGKEW